MTPWLVDVSGVLHMGIRAAPPRAADRTTAAGTGLTTPEPANATAHVHWQLATDGLAHGPRACSSQVHDQPPGTADRSTACVPTRPAPSAIAGHVHNFIRGSPAPPVPPRAAGTFADQLQRIEGLEPGPDLGASQVHTPPPGSANRSAASAPAPSSPCVAFQVGPAAVFTSQRQP